MPPLEHNRDQPPQLHHPSINYIQLQITIENCGDNDVVSRLVVNVFERTGRTGPVFLTACGGRNVCPVFAFRGLEERPR